MTDNVLKNKKEQPVNAWYLTAFARCSFFDFINVGLLFFIVTGSIIFYLQIKEDEPYLCCRLVAEETILQTGEEYETIPLYARGAALIDADSGRILYQKNSREAMPMASTTKIMTCILALENCSLEESVQISKEAASQPPVKANLRQGETYRLGDLLRIMMLESYNDAAYAVAEHVGGSIDNFRNMMNEKAKQLGMENSHFITPNGLDAADEKGTHSASAYDMSLLGRYAILNDSFLEIISERNAVISDLEGKRSISAVNRDAFLDQMEGSIGIKTGFTNGAGYCFVGALRQDEKCLVSAVLGSGWPPSKQYKWRDTRNLMEYGLENYDYNTFEYRLQPRCCLVEDISAYHPDTIMTLEMEAANKSKSYLISESDKVTEKCVYVSKTEGNIKAGEVMGYRMLYINGDLVEKEELSTSIDVNKPSDVRNMKRIFRMFLL